MAIQQLPLQSGLTDYRISVRLDSTDDASGVYGFRFRWNAIDEAWYMDVADAADQPIASGIKVVLGIYLGRRFVAAHPLFRDGVFVAADTSGKRQDAGLLDFGTRVTLTYVPVEDLLAILNQAGLDTEGA